MLAIIIIVILIAIVFYKNRFEKFEIKQNIYPSEPNQDSYERTFNMKYPRDIYDKKNLKGLMFDTRFPGLLKHKYNYDDTKNCETLPVLKDKARLKDLPMHLKNWYHAKVPKCMAETDDYYWEGNIKNNKYKNECFGCMSECKGNDDYYSKIDDLVNAQYCDDYVLDKSFSSLMKNKPIYGFDPTSTLPAQYADRSKTSIEKEIAGAYIRDAYNYPSIGEIPDYYY